MVRRARSCRLHALAALRPLGRRRSQEGEQRLRSLALTRCAANRAGKNRDQLNFGWKQADDIDTRLMHQLAHLLESELDIAACDQGPNWNSGRCLPAPR